MSFWIGVCRLDVTAVMGASHTCASVSISTELILSATYFMIDTNVMFVVCSVVTHSVCTLVINPDVFLAVVRHELFA